MRGGEWHVAVAFPARLLPRLESLLLRLCQPSFLQRFAFFLQSDATKAANASNLQNLPPTCPGDRTQFFSTRQPDAATTDCLPHGKIRKTRYFLPVAQWIPSAKSRSFLPNRLAGGLARDGGVGSFLLPELQRSCQLGTGVSGVWFGSHRDPLRTPPRVPTPGAQSRPRVASSPPITTYVPDATKCHPNLPVGHPTIYRNLTLRSRPFETPRAFSPGSVPTQKVAVVKNLSISAQAH